MKGSRILLVEPDALLAQTYTRALRSQGSVTKCASSAGRAVEIIDDFEPELMIIELQLISHSGIELLYELRSYTDWQSIPVIILSIVPPVEFAASQSGLSRELGVSRYLYKPSTSIRQLIRNASELLQLSANEAT